MISLGRVCFPAGEDVPQSWKAKHPLAAPPRWLRKPLQGDQKPRDSRFIGQCGQGTMTSKRNSASHPFVHLFVQNACWKSAVRCGGLRRQAQARPWNILKTEQTAWRAGFPSLWRVHLGGATGALSPSSLCVHNLLYTSKMGGSDQAPCVSRFMSTTKAFSMLWHNFHPGHFTLSEFHCSGMGLDFPYFLCFITNKVSMKIVMNLTFVFRLFPLNRASKILIRWN